MVGLGVLECTCKYALHVICLCVRVSVIVCDYLNALGLRMQAFMYFVLETTGSAVRRHEVSRLFTVLRTIANVIQYL